MEEKSIQYQELLKVVRSMRREDELFYFFLRACENGNLQICQICLDAGADINIFEHFYNKHSAVSAGKNTERCSRRCLFNHVPEITERHFPSVSDKKSTPYSVSCCRDAFFFFYYTYYIFYRSWYQIWRNNNKIGHYKKQNQQLKQICFFHVWQNKHRCRQKNNKCHKPYTKHHICNGKWQTKNVDIKH